MRKRKKKMSMRKRKALVGYTFIAPWILGAAVFFVFPMIYSLILSFSKPNNISDFDITLVGLENYKEALFTDVKFFGYFVDSVKDAIINPILILAFSLLLAFLVNQKINFKGLFRTTFFLPVVLGSGFIMQQLLGENLQQQTVSVVSEILLSEELTRALPYSVVSFIQELLQRITVILWSSGVQIVLFLGGLQSIPNTIYEAADIDAAGEWEKFWLITFPLLMPTTLLCAIYTIVDSFANSANEALNYIMEVAFDKNSFEVSAAILDYIRWNIRRGNSETVADGQIKLSDIVNTRTCESPDIAVGDYVSLKTDNNYRLFTAGDTKYMVITLEFNPRNAIIEWANEVVEAHSEYKTIVLTHGYTENGELISSSAYYLNNGSKDTDQNEPNVLWDEFVSKHENIFMLFCGHSHAPDITSNVMVGDNGNTVYQYMVAPTMGNGGDGVFLMMYFNETNGTVDFRYYSPTEDKYWGYQNMLQIDLDNSNTNTDIVEVTKPNIATDNILKSFAGGNLNSAGYWLVDNESDSTSEFYKTRFVSDGTVFVNETSSIVRQYAVSADGTAKILVHLDYVRINGGAVDTNKKASIDIQIFNNLGENVTSQFKTGTSAKNAVAGSGTQYVPYNDETFNMVSNGSQTGWIYAEIEGVKAGDSFYFVSTAHDMSAVANTITQKQTIYVSSNVAHTDAETTTVTDVDGEWVSCVKDFPTTSVITDNASRQGYLGWYYKYVSNSVLKNYTYTTKKAEVNVNIVGDGSVSTYTTSATYDATTGKITLPHDNSLFVNVKKSDGSVLTAVYWNDIPVTHTTSADASIRVNVPCVGDGGTLTVIFKPITESVTINGVSNYYDYGMQALGDVNGTDGIDIRDLVRTVSHLEDSTVAIKVYNTDINKDEKIDKNDTSELRNILLQ